MIILMETLLEPLKTDTFPVSYLTASNKREVYLVVSGHVTILIYYLHLPSNEIPTALN